MTGTSSSTPGGPGTSDAHVPVPMATTLKLAAADPKTTNLLLAILVLCISGYMPEQFVTLCGA